DSYSEEDIPMLDGVALPGFIKCHGHDHESPIIGISKDETLVDWLDHTVNMFTGFMNTRRDELTERFGKSPNLIPYLKARLDDIHYGITSCLVNHTSFNKYRIDDLVAANLASGSKMTIAVGSSDQNYDPRVMETIDQAVDRLEQAQKSFGDTERIEIIPGPDQIFSNSPEMLSALKKWADRYGKLVHAHSSEEPETTRWFGERYGRTPIEMAQSAGFLDSRTLLAHQCNSTDHDLEIIRASGATVVHNPLANTIIGDGMPPIIRMMEMGIPVVISTDGAGAADNQNIINAARLAAQYQKAYHRDATLLPSLTLLKMITVEAARALRLNAGSLETGKDADFIILDLSPSNLVPSRDDNIIENIIWAADGNEVQWMVANGLLLRDDYRAVRLDEEKIKRETQELSELMIEYRQSAEEIVGTGVRGEEN
ncbi:MAG: amidohydrolase family protein, partial [Candidatus Auribacterota bacterium]|nr:amidohydrolase family protein [Candidatus Auribacterota bacterium]